jgi:hypothetical protein
VGGDPYILNVNLVLFYGGRVGAPIFIRGFRPHFLLCLCVLLLDLEYFLLNPWSIFCSFWLLPSGVARESAASPSQAPLFLARSSHLGFPLQFSTARRFSACLLFSRSTAQRQICFHLEFLLCWPHSAITDRSSTRYSVRLLPLSSVLL